MQKIFVLSANDRRIFLGLLLSGIVANQSDDCCCSILGHQTSSYGDWWRADCLVYSAEKIRRISVQRAVC